VFLNASYVAQQSLHVRVLKVLNLSPPDNLLEIKNINITAIKLQANHQMVSELSLGEVDFTMIFLTYLKSPSVQTTKKFLCN